MQNIRILNSKEIKHIHQQLEEQFTFTKKLDFAFLMNQKNKIYIVSKDIGSIDLESFRKDSIGLYFAHQATDGIRLTIEGSQLVGPSAKKNILEINSNQLKEYVRGFELHKRHFKEPEGYYLVKHEDDFIGCIKITQDKILSFLSKARRLKVLSC